MEQSVDAANQNMFSIEWKSDHFVTNVLVFEPARHIMGEMFNAPGCTHDSEISEWGGIYTKMKSFYERTGGEWLLNQHWTSIHTAF